MSLHLQLCNYVYSTSPSSSPNPCKMQYVSYHAMSSDTIRYHYHLISFQIFISGLMCFHLQLCWFDKFKSKSKSKSKTMQYAICNSMQYEICNMYLTIQRIMYKPTKNTTINQTTFRSFQRQDDIMTANPIPSMTAHTLTHTHTCTCTHTRTRTGTRTHTCDLSPIPHAQNPIHQK
jgi:hypothetical protein